MENTVKGFISTYSQPILAVWMALWGVAFGWQHAVAFLLWDIPFVITIPDNLYLYSVVIKILILLILIISMKPWNILKTATAGVGLFIVLLTIMSFTPVTIPLKGMLMYMGTMTIVHVVLLYLSLVILSTVLVARDELTPTFISYIILAIDYLTTLSTRNYPPLIVPSVFIPMLAVINLIQQRKVMHRG